jgi:acyl-CoA synthetase (AMP-forming)/AMP-acid ligase II
VQARDDAVRPSVESIQEHCRTHIAGYKVPRELHFVDAIQRSPSGKPDYRWAKDVATATAASERSE